MLQKENVRISFGVHFWEPPRTFMDAFIKVHQAFSYVQEHMYQPSSHLPKAGILLSLAEANSVTVDHYRPTAKDPPLPKAGILLSLAEQSASLWTNHYRPTAKDPPLPKAGILLSLAEANSVTVDQPIQFHSKGSTAS
jgi:hypothetical protein